MIEKLIDPLKKEVRPQLIFIYIHTYLYIYICVCVCIYV